MSSYDAIVIGSGIGGLTCAAAMAKKGKKVLMLEKAARPGGCMQPFNPDGGTEPCGRWNLGLQWICGYDVNEQRTMANDYDNLMYLSSWDDDAAPDDIYKDNGKVPRPTLTKLDLDFHFAHFVDVARDIDFEFDMYSDREAMKKHLIDKFPEETKGIERYYGYLEKLQKNVLYVAACKVFPSWLGGLLYPFMIFFGFPWMSIRLFPFTRRTAQSVVESIFTDARLKMIIYSYWHFLGMPIDKIPFLFFGIAQNLQLRGVFYPDGGADGIIKPLLKTVTDAGGALRCNHEVKHFDVSGKKIESVSGVCLNKDGSQADFTLSAPAIVSSMGINESLALMDEKDRPGSVVRAAAKHSEAPSILVLRVEFKDSLEGFKLSKATYRYIFGETSHVYDDPTIRGWLPKDITINFPSLYDATEATLGCAGLRGEIVLETRHEYFSDYAEAYARGEHKQEGTELYDVYQRVSQALVERMAEYFQRRSGLDIRPHIKQTWLTSPLDVTAMTDHQRGAIYGLDINKAKDMNLQPRSGIKGLYFAGEDVFCQGVTFINGLFSASVVLGDWFMATKIPIIKQ